MSILKNGELSRYHNKIFFDLIFCGAEQHQHVALCVRYVCLSKKKNCDVARRRTT